MVPAGKPGPLQSSILATLPARYPGMFAWPSPAVCPGTTWYTGLIDHMRTLRKHPHYARFCREGPLPPPGGGEGVPRTTHPGGKPSRAPVYGWGGL